MNGRASFVLALGLLTGVAGCTPPSLLPLASSNSTPKPAPPPSPPAATPAASPTAADLPPSDGKPKKPHAPTFVAAGQLAEKSARDPARTAAERANLLEEARKSFQQAIATDPNYLPAYTALADLYLAQGDQERCFTTYRQVIKAHPKEAALWFGLGMCYSRLKRWDEAVTNLRKAHELDPDNRPYADTLGYCLARAGRYEESLACFRELVGEARAHYNLARMLHHMKHDDLARQHLQLALRADPQLAPARQLLVQLNGGRPAAGVVQAAAPTEDQDGDEDDNPGR
jgi:tetratricopeptide (TPR) repeat protein